MSSKIADDFPLAVELVESHPQAEGGPAMAIVLAPATCACLTLLIHQFFGNRQSLPVSWTPWFDPYPLLLEFFGTVALLLAAVYWAGQPQRPWIRHHAPRFTGALLALCLWDLVTQKLNWMVLPYFPGPDLVLEGMIADRDILFESAWHSLRLLLSGYAVGVGAGLATGIWIGWFPRARYWGMPVLKVIGPIPATALIPLMMTLSQGSFLPATMLIGFAVWFPVTMLTLSGIANVRLAYLDVARTLGAGRYYLIFHVAVPAALPYIFIGLFMGLGVSFLTLIVAETVGVQAGLGWYVKWQQGYMEYAKMYGALILMAGFFSGLMTLLFMVRDRMLKWQQGVIKW